MKPKVPDAPIETPPAPEPAAIAETSFAAKVQQQVVPAEPVATEVKAQEPITVAPPVAVP